MIYIKNIYLSDLNVCGKYIGPRFREYKEIYNYSHYRYIAAYCSLETCQRELAIIAWPTAAKLTKNIV